MLSKSLLNILLLGGAASTANAACTRDDLKAAASSYVEAQAAGKPSFTALDASPDVAYSENFKTVPVATGILSQALKIDFNRSIYDTTQCATYTELVSATGSHPYVIGTQMRFADGDASKVTKMESIVTDKGDWLFNATGTLYYASREAWPEIPEDKRDSREAIKAAGDAYCDLFNDKSAKVPWGTPCERLEGGMYTGRGSPTDSCNVGVPSGVKLIDRRYVIDEVMGTVDIFMTFGSIPDSHEFRVENGKLRFVHTMSVMGG